MLAEPNGQTHARASIRDNPGSPLLPATSMLQSCRPVLLFLLLFWLTACGDAEVMAPQINAARVVLPPPGTTMAAGYFEILNPGRTALDLRRVSSTAFAAVEMHETLESDGVSKMRPLERVRVAPGQVLRFVPGGRHLMLMEPKFGDPPPAELVLSLEVQGTHGQLMTVDAVFQVEGAGGPGKDPAITHNHTHQHHQGGL